jgi:hypothetical protein
VDFLHQFGGRSVSKKDSEANELMIGGGSRGSGVVNRWFGDWSVHEKMRRF